MNPTRLNPAKENLELKRTIQALLLEIEDLQTAKKGICNAALQMSLDITIITLQDVFHVGPKMFDKFAEAYKANYTEIANLIVDDEKADDTLDMTYSREVVDRRIRKIVGADRFAPWAERYRDVVLEYIPSTVPSEVHDVDD